MDKKIIREDMIFALGIALLPPLWAVAAPYFHISTGSVALICAGIYAANGNRTEDGLKMMFGFWCGDLWAVLALVLLHKLSLPERVELFLVLSILGGVAALIGTQFSHKIYLPAWLSGWAIGLSLMTYDSLQNDRWLPIQIGVSMAVGVWYVGAGTSYFTKCLLKKKKGNKNGD